MKKNRVKKDQECSKCNAKGLKLYKFIEKAINRKSSFSYNLCYRCLIDSHMEQFKAILDNENEKDDTKVRIK